MGNLRLRAPDILHDNENKNAAQGIDGIIRHRMDSYLFPHSKVNTRTSKNMKMDDNDVVMDVGVDKTNPIVW